MKKLIPITQASESTGLSVTTLRRAVKAGRIPVIRAGGGGRGKLLFDIDLVQQILEQEAMASMSADRGGDGWDDEPEPDHEKSGLVTLFTDNSDPFSIIPTIKYEEVL